MGVTRDWFPWTAGLANPSCGGDAALVPPCKLQYVDDTSNNNNSES